MKLVSPKVMRSLDALAMSRYGLTGLQLMENAGRGVAECALELLKESKGTWVSILAGKGNNGGDGFVVARFLKNRGYNVKVFSTAPVSAFKGDAAINARVWRKMSGETIVIKKIAELEKEASFLKHSVLIVDALLGTGITSEVRGVTAGIIDYINGLDRSVLSVDIPSGIDGLTGAVLGSAIRAEATATMAISKIGLHIYPGREYAGKVAVVDIGMPATLFEDRRLRWTLIDERFAGSVLESKEVDSHKGSNGRLLVVAASPGLTGAAYMASMGAIRAGTGLVTLGVPASLNPVMEAKTTEAMTVALPETESGRLSSDAVDAILEAASGKDAIVIGPGLGLDEDITKLLKALLKPGILDIPLLLDADALNALSGSASAIKRSGLEVVITPHPGEAARLLGVGIEDILKDKVGAAELLAKKSGAVTILKGAGTVIATPGKEIFINPTGDASLATGGTGDILSGIIGALLAQGKGALASAVTGVYLHGLAAESITEALDGTSGMAATDLLVSIPPVMNRLVEVE